jgi:hypothetical protein
MPKPPRPPTDEQPGLSRRSFVAGVGAGLAAWGCRPRRAGLVKRAAPTYGKPMRDPVIRTRSLGFQWETADPFLFCVHHLDRYPRGNERLGPAASLVGRDLGQDFAGIDGWRMYHGEVVPGFPRHPHRGFETVTIARRGFIDHSDSMGATARYGKGDVQWLTAGGGIEHAEMFPLVRADADNPVELFQIWLNLPASDKMVAPHFSMFWGETVPRLRSEDEQGRRVDVTVIAGRLGDTRALAPPPHSWGARPEADVAIWSIDLGAGARFTLPPANEGTVRTVYFFDGPSLRVGGRTLASRTGAEVHAAEPVVLEADGGAAEVLVLQGRPIGEPIARYGPFVMNTQAEIRRAFSDYRATRFGGWPWPAADPVHARQEGRFARHADGRLERAPA